MGACLLTIEHKVPGECMPRFRALLTGGLLFAAAIVPSAHADALLDRARQQLDAGSAEAAYQTLAPLESERAGDPTFDLLLGRAALASDRPGLALFALERAVAIEPENAAARIEYARAYAAAGLLKQARQELAQAKATNPSPTVKEAIRALDDLLNVVQIGVRRGLRGSINFSTGLDSNINGATDERIVPGVVGPIDERFREQGDAFIGFGAAVDYQGPAFGQWDVIAGGRARHHANVSNRFDFTALGAYVGLSTARGPNEWSGTVGFDRFSRDGNSLRGDVDASVRWRHALSKRQILSVYGKASHLEYDNQSARDGNRYVAGARYLHSFDAKYAPLFQVGVYGGTVDTKSTGNPQLDYDLAGVSLNAQARINKQVTVFGSTGYEIRDYDGAVTTSRGAKREDESYRFGAGVHVKPAAGWRITPSMSYRRNDSNAAISDHERALFTIQLRREFN
jgi:tetratricopeptide (TPR) repeat protein